MVSSVVRSVVLGVIGLLMQAPIGVANAQDNAQDNAPGETAVAKDSAASTSMKVQVTNAGTSPVKVRRLQGKELELAPQKSMAFTATALPLTLEFLPGPNVDQWVKIEFPKAGNYKYETTGETFSVTPVEPAAKTAEKKTNVGGNIARANTGRGNVGRGNVRRGSVRRGNVGRAGLLRTRASATQCVCWCVCCCCR